MSVDEIHFLEQTKAMLSERGKRNVRVHPRWLVLTFGLAPNSDQVMKTNREQELYEHELYFIAQMFEKSWQPRDSVIDRTEGTVNNVGLKKYAGQ